MLSSYYLCDVLYLRGSDFWFCSCFSLCLFSCESLVVLLVWVTHGFTLLRDSWFRCCDDWLLILLLWWVTLGFALPVSDLWFCSCEWLLVLVFVSVLTSDLVFADINECITDRMLCDKGQCRNTPGSYHCICPTGYRFSTETKACEGLSKILFKPKG